MTDLTKILDALMGANAAPARTGVGVAGGDQRPVPSQAGAGSEAFGGGFASVIRTVLGEAASGMKDAARDVDARTGIGGKANDMLTQATGGRGVGDLLAQARQIASENQLATGAAIGGLAGLLLGTGAGRDIAATTAKLGGLAVIGGLAYKAYQNYQSGKPLINLDPRVEPAPAESPFGNTDNAEQDQRTASLLIRTMIAAAAADGTIDDTERRLIVGGLERAGLDADAAKALEQEFARPASIETLVAQVPSPEIAAEVFTAARLAVDPDQASEQQFLARLAEGLKLAPELVRNIDAATRNAAASR